MTATEQMLIKKIKQLPPQRMQEVEDFVDFLRAREGDPLLARGAAKASEPRVARWLCGSLTRWSSVSYW